MSDNKKLNQVLQRLLGILPSLEEIDWQQQIAAQWRQSKWLGKLSASSELDDVNLDDLLHIEDQKGQLVTNTEQFLAGLPANNALLWGARGTGKSSIVHALLNTYAQHGLRLVEINREDLASLTTVIEQLAQVPFHFVVFCDDLSFEAQDPAYKALKSALEGSVFKTAGNVLFYATSNRRHLVPEYASDNTNSHLVEGELHHGEAVEEKISLSDRFGLWLSFYPFKQDAYLEVVLHWVTQLAKKHQLDIDLADDQLRVQALQWALARGVRNGRTAQYFARYWVGQRGLSDRSVTLKNF